MSHIRVFKHHLHKLYLLLGLIELALLIAAVTLGVNIVVYTPLFEQENGVLKAAVFSLTMSCCTLSMGVYLSYVKESLAGMALRTIISFCLLGTGALTIIYYVLPDLHLGRGALFWFTMIAIALVLTTRWLFFHTVNLSKLRRRIVILGAGKQAKNILDNLYKEQSSPDVEVFRCLSDGDTPTAVDDNLIDPYPSNWAHYMGAHRISEIVVAPDERRRSEGGSFPEKELLNCKMAGVIVSDVLSFFERELSKVEVNLLH